MITKENLESNIKICLNRIPDKHKFQLEDIREIQVRLIARFNSSENKKWYVKIEAMDFEVIENKFIQGMIYHELGHYFFDEDCKNGKYPNLTELDETVDEFVIKNWDVKTETELMRENDIISIATEITTGKKFAESCSEDIW